MLQHADELSLLQAQIAYKKKMEAVMQELTAQEAALLDKTARLKDVMLREQKDVARLETPSLSGFFYQITGQMENILTKERREAYAARVKYEAALRELEAIQEDIRETREDLEDLRGCDRRYQAVLDEVRLSLERVQDLDGRILLEKETLLTYLTQQQHELEEAISCGTSALRTMAETQQSLHSAKDWGTHENRGPAFWADRARQEKMDDAQKHVELLQHQLQQFNRELSDITIRPSLQPSIDRMLQFADTFFDTLLADMPAIEKISRSCSLADQTGEHILGVLRQLQSTLEEVRQRHTSLRQEMDSIVLQAVSEM